MPLRFLPYKGEDDGKVEAGQKEVADKGFRQVPGGIGDDDGGGGGNDAVLHDEFAEMLHVKEAGYAIDKRQRQR